MHNGFIMLTHSPYGSVGFKLSSSDTVRVAQSPASLKSYRVWSSKHKECANHNKKKNIFLDILLLFAQWSVNSPTLTTNHPHGETRSERWSTHCSGLWWMSMCVCVCVYHLHTHYLLQTFVGFLARPDGNRHKKRGGVFPFLWACAITSQFEFLHLLMHLHRPKKTTTVPADRINHREMDEWAPSRPLTSASPPSSVNPWHWMKSSLRYR